MIDVYNLFDFKELNTSADFPTKYAFQCIINIKLATKKLPQLAIDFPDQIQKLKKPLIPNQITHTKKNYGDK